MQEVQSAGIIVFREHNGKREYLLLHYQHGHWDFAKGKREEGEELKATAHRELKEETGLTAFLISGFEVHYSFYFTEVNGQEMYKIVTLFLGRSDQKKIVLSDEHVGYVWMPYLQAINQLTYENSKNALKKAEQFFEV